jgi:hypothetical protein
MTGIDYPTITVGAHENLVVRFSLAAQLLMRRRGIDPVNIFALCAPRLQDGSANLDAVRNVLTIFAACVAENFLDLSKPHRVDLDTAPTADYWATQVEDFAAIEAVIGAALGKAAEERRKRLAVVPPATEQAS